MIIVENYRRAKSPLNSSSIVSLCEEETIIYDVKYREIKFNKLYLLCNSSGIRFSNQEIAEENKKRIEEALKTKTTKKSNKKNKENG